MIASTRAAQILIGFGVINVVLYAGLQPLWEGFDESYHYGYVQELSRHGRLPVLGRTCLSEEIWQSMGAIPVSYRVKENVRRGVSYEEYWRLTADERRAMRDRLQGIDRGLGGQASHSPNYESHHAPLAYLLLSPLDWALSRVVLSTRILVLRIFCGLVSVLLTALAAIRLERLLALAGPWRLTAPFLIFSSQMFYATTAHISNDWLAVPLLTMLLAQCAAVHIQPNLRNVALLGAALAAALLTKAYFLAMAPLVVAVVLWGTAKGRITGRDALVFAALASAAVPWYVRNLALYRNLSGMQETLGGTPFGKLAASALRLPWLKSWWSEAHMSLWTGNSSLTTFQQGTITAMLVMVLAAASLCVRAYLRRKPGGAEVVTLAGLLSFLSALAYSANLTFCYTKGVGIAPSPTYAEALWPPLLIWLMLGLPRAGRIGNGVRIAMIWLWTYVIAATYVAKLVPFYAGLTKDRARFAEIPAWWAKLITGSSGLDTAALLPASVIVLLTVAVTLLAIVLATWLSAGYPNAPRNGLGYHKLNTP